MPSTEWEPINSPSVLFSPLYGERGNTGRPRHGSMEETGRFPCGVVLPPLLAGAPGNVGRNWFPNRPRAAYLPYPRFFISLLCRLLGCSVPRWPLSSHLLQLCVPWLFPAGGLRGAPVSG